MKKIIALFCVLAIALTMLASCDLSLDHDHEFSDEKWDYDADYHWHPCVVSDSCGEQKDKEPHAFTSFEDADGNVHMVCEVCGAIENEIAPDDSGDGSDTDAVTVPEHTHEYGETLQSNARYHWYACLTEGCGQQKDKVGHVFGNPEVTYADKEIVVKYTCVDCGYENTVREEVKTEVDNAVAWNEAFKNFKLVNFTMDVLMVGQSHTQHNHCVVTENEAYYCIPDTDGVGNEFYTVPNGDGTYTTYQRNHSRDPFKKLGDTSDSFLKGAQTETVIQVSFENNFEKFTYDKETASYVCDEIIPCVFYRFDGTANEQTLYCYESVVKLTDGAISYIESKYYIGEPNPEGFEQSFKYYNIGMSAVEVPQSVIDSAVIGTPPENEEENLTETVPFNEIDVDFYYWTAENEYVDLSQENVHVLSEDILWEPGYNQVVYFSLTNKSVLATRCVLEMFVENVGDVNLSDVLIYEVIPDAQYGSLNTRLQGGDPLDHPYVPIAEILLEPGETAYYAIQVAMIDSASSDYMGADIRAQLQMKVLLVDDEDDSFNQDYDPDYYPEYSEEVPDVEHEVVPPSAEVEDKDEENNSYDENAAFPSVEEEDNGENEKLPSNDGNDVSYDTEKDEPIVEEAHPID
ncbi:MAG: hypothetical protein IKA76_00045 [Clostridia bacterium]|nr:hypothetical protein [Clostridia bacterium]